MSSQPAIFLDRDGVLNYLVNRDGGWFSPQKLADFVPVWDLKSAMNVICGRGFLPVVVTNQPDVARGRLTVYELDLMHEVLQTFGITHFYVCTHDDTDRCQCRKPKPGLLLQAIDELVIDPGKSLLIGDREVDIAAGQALGIESYQIQGARLGNLDSDGHFERLPSYLTDALRGIMGLGSSHAE